jgi:CheY-like chemotaxis protein
VVVRAYGGSVAIALAHRLRPDLILLDLVMPEVSGFDVVAALQNNSATARIPILIVTAFEVNARERALLSSHSEKAVHVVEKAGINRADFLAEVRRALLPH